MAEEELERAYEELVERARMRGEAEASREQQERRRETRLRPDVAHVVVGDDPWVFVINVSKAGLAFYTDVARQPGTGLAVRLEGGPTVQAVVVDCLLDAVEPAAMAGRFRVNCAFSNPDRGLRFFLALKRMEEATLESTQGMADPVPGGDAT